MDPAIVIAHGTGRATGHPGKASLNQVQLVEKVNWRIITVIVHRIPLESVICRLDVTWSS